MYVFFFQAEDGIRDIGVTGVQTCTLPISTRAKAQELAEQIAAKLGNRSWGMGDGDVNADPSPIPHHPSPTFANVEAANRSEERRVGKECRSRWSPYH